MLCRTQDKKVKCLKISFSCLKNQFELQKMSKNSKLCHKLILSRRFVEMKIHFCYDAFVVKNKSNVLYVLAKKISVMW